MGWIAAFNRYKRSPQPSNPHSTGPHRDFGLSRFRRFGHGLLRFGLLENLEPVAANHVKTPILVLEAETVVGVPGDVNPYLVSLARQATMPTGGRKDPAFANPAPMPIADVSRSFVRESFPLFHLLVLVLGVVDDVMPVADLLLTSVNRRDGADGDVGGAFGILFRRH